MLAKHQGCSSYHNRTPPRRLLRYVSPAAGASPIRDRPLVDGVGAPCVQDRGTPYREGRRTLSFISTDTRPPARSQGAPGAHMTQAGLPSLRAQRRRDPPGEKRIIVTRPNPVSLCFQFVWSRGTSKKHAPEIESKASDAIQASSSPVLGNALIPIVWFQVCPPCPVGGARTIVAWLVAVAQPRPLSGGLLRPVTFETLRSRHHGRGGDYGSRALGWAEKVRVGINTTQPAAVRRHEPPLSHNVSR
jgi:hypothetical protein